MHVQVGQPQVQVGELRVLVAEVLQPADGGVAVAHALELVGQLHLQIPVIGIEAERLLVFPDRFLVPAEQLQQVREAGADGLLLRLVVQDRAMVCRPPASSWLCAR